MHTPTGALRRTAIVSRLRRWPNERGPSTGADGVDSSPASICAAPRLAWTARCMRVRSRWSYPPSPSTETEAVIGSILFAADYPFLDVLWSILIFMAFVLWIWLAISCFIDIFRRRDTGGFVKALWVIALIVLPFLGLLVYLIVNHRGIADRRARDVQAEQ